MVNTANVKKFVIWHSVCMDGSCAGYIAQQALSNEPGEVILVPGIYDQPCPDFVKDGEVYLVDFSYKRKPMLELARKNHSVTIIDHHKTAQAELDRIDEAASFDGYKINCIFDMNKCGSMLTHEYFFGEGDMPWQLPYVQDKDLYKFELPNSREINAAFSTYAPVPESWEEIFKLKKAQCIKAGNTILRKKRVDLDYYKSLARDTVFEGHKIKVVNCPDKSLVSDLGHELCIGKAFCLMWWQDQNGKYQYSLRSEISEDNKCGVDVSDIARKFGGGGHPMAAGCTADVLLAP